MDYPEKTQWQTIFLEEGLSSREACCCADFIEEMKKDFAVEWVVWGEGGGLGDGLDGAEEHVTWDA
ncbi:hypothetical protein E2562_018567 [Oryza meyeriana var. granulata]|uniref:Uncharacterized protein n=1 Tax=Oryza meyeriana var. granulata TaxID=110450 RepID=A0A6G1F9E0_9ORYZ|nr:hypothetical protein E2562_018567 [Oryza meyeriana var. granulata]